MIFDAKTFQFLLQVSNFSNKLRVLLQQFFVYCTDTSSYFCLYAITAVLSTSAHLPDDACHFIFDRIILWPLRYWTLTDRGLVEGVRTDIWTRMQEAIDKATVRAQGIVVAKGLYAFEDGLPWCALVIMEVMAGLLIGISIIFFLLFFLFIVILQVFFLFFIPIFALMLSFR